MPELPEIETLVRQLRQVAVGASVADVECAQPRMLNLPLEQYRPKVRGPIAAASRRGKSAVLSLEQGSLWLHLGLRGTLRYLAPSTEPLNTMVTFLLADGARLALLGVFMGHAHFLSPIEHQARWQQLGVDALAADLTPTVLRAVLLRKPRLDVKGALMEQSLLAGVGNIYSDEILFAARLHPARSAGALTKEEIQRLHGSLHDVLEEAVELGGEESYVDLFGTPGRFRPRIHGRDVCPICHHSVQATKFRGRTAYFCPACQPTA